MKKPKHIAALEVFAIDSDLDKLRKRIEAKPMPPLEGEALLKILDVADIPDYLNAINPHDLPFTVKQIRTLHALALYGDANAIHLLFLSNVWCMWKKLEIGGKHDNLEFDQFLAQERNQGYRKLGGDIRALQKSSEAAKINAWLHPMFLKHYQILLKSFKRVGQKRLGAAVYKELKLKGDKEQKSKLVTRARAQAWLEKHKPVEPTT